AGYYRSRADGARNRTRCAHAGRWPRSRGDRGGWRMHGTVGAFRSHCGSGSQKRNAVWKASAHSPGGRKHGASARNRRTRAAKTFWRLGALGNRPTRSAGQKESSGVEELGRAHLVCRLLLDKKKKGVVRDVQEWGSGDGWGHYHLPG